MITINTARISIIILIYRKLNRVQNVFENHYYRTKTTVK